MEGAPAELDVGGHGLGVGRDLPSGARPEHRRHERPALGLPVRADPGQVEDGRKNVSRADLGRHALPREPFKRRDDDERHVDGVIVDVVPVRSFAMAAQAFAVVSGITFSYGGLKVNR